MPENVTAQGVEITRTSDSTVSRLRATEVRTPFDRLMETEISKLQRDVDALADQRAANETTLQGQRSAVARARQLLADAERNLAEQERAHDAAGELLTQRRLLLVNAQARMH